MSKKETKGYWTIFGIPLKKLANIWVLLYLIGAVTLLCVYLFGSPCKGGLSKSELASFGRSFVVALVATFTLCRGTKWLAGKLKK